MRMVTTESHKTDSFRSPLVPSTLWLYRLIYHGTRTKSRGIRSRKREKKSSKSNVVRSHSAPPCPTVRILHLWIHFASVTREENWKRFCASFLRAMLQWSRKNGKRRTSNRNSHWKRWGRENLTVFSYLRIYFSGLTAFGNCLGYTCLYLGKQFISRTESTKGQR